MVIEPGQLVSFDFTTKLFSSIGEDCKFMGYTGDENLGVVIGAEYVVDHLYYRVLLNGGTYWVPSKYIRQAVN